jgi:hypothetical protein
MENKIQVKEVKARKRPAKNSAKKASVRISEQLKDRADKM